MLGLSRRADAKTAHKLKYKFLTLTSQIFSNEGTKKSSQTIAKA